MEFFTSRENAAWVKKLQEADIAQPGDTWNTNWNRKSAIQAQWRAEKLKRMSQYPTYIVRYFVVEVGEALTGNRKVIYDEDIWEDIHTSLSEDADPDLIMLFRQNTDKSEVGCGFQDRYEAVNTPQVRWTVHTLLSSLAVIPRSWGRSATLRFWRGIGKQAKFGTKYPGFGVLSADNGWTTREADAISYVFCKGDVGSLLMEDCSDDQVDAVNRDEDVEYGVEFVATRKERDDAFIKMLLGLLEKEGLDAPAPPPKKEVKEYVKKTLTVGQVIEQKHLKDLSEGDLLRWTVLDRYSKKGHLVYRVYELMFVSRSTGKIQYRPICKNKAFAILEGSSSRLYGYIGGGKEGKAEYLGKFSGDIVDVEVKWEPVTTRSEKINE